MQTDPLSDLLRPLRLRGVVFYRIGFPAVWAMEAAPMRELGRLLCPDAEQVMTYHLLARGAGWATLEGLAPVRLGAGDVVVLPQGDAHVLSSDRSPPPPRIDPAWIAATRAAPTPVPMAFHSPCAFLQDEDAPAENELVCGFLGCDRHLFHPLFAALPRLLHLPACLGMDMPLELGRLALRAGRGQPGAAALLERAGETLLIDALRRYLERLPAQETGWLTGLRDPRIGRALALIHRAPARPWTIDDLARAAGLSRSVFCARFLRLLGQPPMHYLARWRMDTASTLLRTSAAPVASVALDVGYASEAAFARAFKRATGTSPARWRRLRSSVPGGATE